jgi:hypothetical protein
MIARAEVVKEDGSLTHDCDNYGYCHGFQFAPLQSLELRNRRDAYARRRYRRYLISISDPARVGPLTLHRANQTSLWSDSS